LIININLFDYYRTCSVCGNVLRI